MHKLSVDLTPWWWTRTASRSPRLLLPVFTTIVALDPIDVAISATRIEVVLASDGSDHEKKLAHADAARDVLDALVPSVAREQQRTMS